MSSILPSAVRSLLPAIILVMVAGCGMLPLGKGRKVASSPREPGLSRAKDRGDWHAFPGSNRDDDRPPSDEVTWLETIIDREFPNVDDRMRSELVAQFRTEDRKVAATTLRMLGGQWRLKQAENRDESLASSPGGFSNKQGRFPDEEAVAGRRSSGFRDADNVRSAGYATIGNSANGTRSSHPDARHDDWDNRPGNDGMDRRGHQRRASEANASDPRWRGLNEESKGELRSGFGADLLGRLPFTRNGSSAKDENVQQAGNTVDADWNKSLQRLIALTDERMLKSSGDATRKLSPKEELLRVREHVYLRMLYLMSGRTEKTIEAIPGLKPKEQEFWQDTLWGISNYFQSDSMADRGTRATQTVERLRKAVYNLRDFADLEIRNLRFCRDIAGYGNYDPVPKPVFRAGERALIYAEIENFTSQLTKDARYETRIQSSIDIYDETGRRMGKSFNFDATTDVCRERRRDYFHSYIIDLPLQLPPGNYVLKLTVKDELGDKIASDRIGFEID